MTPNDKLFEAANTNDVAAARDAIAAGADVNTNNDYGCTPLHYAAASNAKDVAELLRKHGATE